MAFRVVLALIPFLLFLLALLGFLDLQEVWRSDLAPEFKKNASEVAFKLVDDTVRQVLSQKQVWWLTIGLVADALGALGGHAGDDVGARPGVRLPAPARPPRDAAALAGARAVSWDCAW